MAEESAYRGGGVGEGRGGGREGGGVYPPLPHGDGHWEENAFAPYVVGERGHEDGGGMGEGSGREGGGGHGEEMGRDERGTP